MQITSYKPTAQDLAVGCNIKISMDTNKPESKPTDKLKPGFEAVFTITDYHDGPRKGIANYHGQPHFYECIFDDAKDDYSELFWLTPLDANQSDKIDARGLAELLRLNHLSPVYHGEHGLRCLKELVRSYLTIEQRCARKPGCQYSDVD